MHLFLKIFSGIANSVDPNQTAPKCLFAYAVLSEILVYEIFRTFTVVMKGKYNKICRRTCFASENFHQKLNINLSLWT